MERFIDEFDDPADHLAMDEALLLEADGGRLSESLRIWEFRRHVVVAGRSTRVGEEIDQPFCESREIPILRRCSGGASVVGGAGCLMYSVVLSLEKRGELRKIDAAHRHVMGRVLTAVQQQLPETVLQGTCDLTWQNRKCSGNSLRIARQHLLYHGTVLYDFDLPLISRCLTDAPRQPEYRQQRGHDAFVTNVPVEPEQLVTDLCREFGVERESAPDALEGRIRELREQRYDSTSWHFRH